MSIQLSETAQNHIGSYLKKRGAGLGIRLGVRTSGCSGMAYVLEYVDVADKADEKFTFGDVNVFIDPKSLIYLSGTELDFVKEGLNEGFVFNNPNVNGECGCR